MSFKEQGIYAAVPTPLDADGRVAIEQLNAHVDRMLSAGLDGIALFGTTGEGPSFTVAERRDTLESMLSHGVSTDRVIPATGAAALGDAIELTRHALASGCANVLLLPPFFFKGVTSEGVADAVSRVIDAANDPALRVILYHIPQVAGVGFDDTSIAVLRERYGPVIAGIKDSAGSAAHSLALIKNHPALNVYVGAENTIAAATQAGGAGSICGLANIIPKHILSLYESNDAASAAVVDELIRHLADKAFTSELKSWLADSYEHESWRRVRAPLVASRSRIPVVI
jgi:4-hydroxy-tetrahydrodipicolinate synthase